MLLNSQKRHGFMSYAQSMTMSIALVFVLAPAVRPEAKANSSDLSVRQSTSTSTASSPSIPGSEQKATSQTGVDPGRQAPATTQQQSQSQQKQQQNQPQNEQQSAITNSAAQNSLNISVVGDGVSSPLQLLKCRQSLLVLKNNDNATYVTSIVVVFEGRELRVPEASPGSAAPATVTFQPHSTRIVAIGTPRGWFDSRSWIRPSPGKMQLLISTEPGNDSQNSQPSIQIPPIDLNVQFAAHSPQGYQTISLFIVFFVLLAGGMASLALNTLVPVALKKLTYKKQMQSLADDTSAVSLRVDSRLRVLLRIERNRLSKLLQSVPTFVSLTADVFQELDTGIADLRKRVIVAQRLDDVRERFDAVSNSCPPSLSDRIEKYLQAAADRLRSLYITQKSIDDANASLDAAEQALSASGDSDAQAKQIAANHQELLKEVAALKADELTLLKKALPGIFQVLELRYDENNPVLPSNFIAVDSSIARVHVAMDYAFVRNATADVTIMARLEKKEPELITLLGTLGWRALRASRELVQQMRENIYVDDLIDALKADNAEIALDQQAARAYLPLNFRIHFRKPEYNTAQALSDLTCAWAFWHDADQRLIENGWEVCHFFQHEGVNHISASVPLQAVSSMAGETTAAGGVRPQKDFSTRDLSVRGRDRAYRGEAASIFRFTIAFFIALAGLLAGAQDQLVKLDVIPGIIAVFLLGFGADSIKNLLAQPTQTIPNAQPSPSIASGQPTASAQSAIKN
jgi:hypothetical protein